MLEIALDCIRRGWYVFPCLPRSKKPATEHGFKDASTFEPLVRGWWAGMPDANVAIATGPSGLCVVDVDHGVQDLPGVWAWLDAHGMPLTYAVRTGRRPEFGVQLYYTGTGLKSTGWQDFEVSGDIRCSTGYVMAAGSIHPDSGEAYTVANYGGLNPVPEFVKTLTKAADVFDPATSVDDATADGWKTWLLEYMDRNRLESRDYEKRVQNGWWLGITCPWVEQHGSGPGAESSTVLGILDGHLAFECSHGTCGVNKRDTANFKEWVAIRAEAGADNTEPGAGPDITIGTGLPMPKPEVPVDWRTRYMTLDSFKAIEPPEFLIDGFLVKRSIVMLAGPVAQRKSLVALNIVHALCTGNPLFGYFNVAGGHTRVVYLCPEMGGASLKERILAMGGLEEHIGTDLFIQTMNETVTPLSDLEAEVPGAVIIVDTITRFVDGDENKSEDMRKFAQKVFRLAKEGATIVLLHHSKKGSSGSLDDGLRGSSELAAFVDSVWVTELEDTKKPYTCLSSMRNVKQRDFKCDPFKLKPVPESPQLDMDGEPAPEAVIKDKKEEAARAALVEILKDTPKAGINKLRDELKKRGHGKGQKWVTVNRCEILGTGAVLTSE